jgi:3-oxoacyl-[acyl-carrier protein] reductase
MDLHLSGKNALVTGGTKGIGGAVVDLLVAEGAHVAFCARNHDEVKAKEEASGAHGRALDVADADALTAWVHEEGEASGIDILVANVSALALGPGEQQWRASFEVDLMHTVRVVEAALPYLRASAQASEGGASIVAVASAAGREITFEDNSYGVMKAAVVHYVSGLARTLAPQGIRANSVSPGTIFVQGGIWNAIEQSAPEQFAQALALNPRGRMGNPEEVAYGVALLASPRASWISGTNLIVDGSLTRGIQF